MATQPHIDQIQSECRRCGTCCMKGGPGLHLEDQPLVESGKIPLNTLFTIREGEPAFDNIAARIFPAKTDIIKIKGANKYVGPCGFYKADKNDCLIYDHRPAECHALKCWDTHDIEALYNCKRLTRSHLLSQVPGLWELVRDHQERCDYLRVSQWATKLKQTPGDATALESLLETIRYDHNLRQVTVERSQLDPAMLSFLFGRPLSETIQMFKLKLIKHDDGYLLKPC